MGTQLATNPPGTSSAENEPHWLFYDGGCGLCHGWVQWLLRRDRAAVFLFAPLGGESFQSRIANDRQQDLPDSIVLLTPSGELLLKSTAVRAMLHQIGNPWRILGAAMSVIPRSLADWGYDVIAKIRHRLFKKPSDVCPIVPPELRSRFRP